MLVVGAPPKKKFIEDRTDDLKYPQEWELKKRLEFNLMSPRIKIRSHRNTDFLMLPAMGESNELALKAVSSLSQKVFQQQRGVVSPDGCSLKG